MKKSTILPCLIIIMLMSCTTGVEQEHTDYIIASESPDVLLNGQPYDENIYEFTSRGIFFAKNKSTDITDFEDYRDSWYYRLESLYDIKLEPHDTYGTEIATMFVAFNTDEYLNAVKTGIDNGTIGGLFTTRDFDSVKMLKECGYIIPLNDYIIDNTEWRALPVEWKTAFVIDGKIWAMPYTFQKTVAFRCIRTDWLDNLNFEKPVTVDEFYEVMKGFTYEDPDNDGIDNTYGASFYGGKGFADIFASFDARFNQDAQAVPVWNPNSNLWEDSFLKGSFSDCLAFLRMCYEEKLVVNDFYSFSSGYSGSLFDDLDPKMDAKSGILKSRPNNGEPEIGYITGLSHYIDENITGYYTKYQAPMVLTKNSRYPSSTINIFLDNFMTDYDCYMTARFGIGEYPFTIDGTLLLHSNDMSSRDQENNYPQPSLVGNSPFYEYYPVVNYRNEDEMNEMISHIQRINLVKNNDMCYMIPNEYINTNHTLETEKNIDILANLSRNLVWNTILGNISYEDGLVRYRNEAKKRGMQEFLDYQNALLGKTSEQHY